MLVISVSVSVQQVECQYAVRTRNVPGWPVRLVAPRACTGAFVLVLTTSLQVLEPRGHVAAVGTVAQGS